MAFFKDRLGSLGGGIKNAVTRAKDKTMDTVASLDLQELKDKAATIADSSVSYGKEKVQSVKEGLLSAVENFDSEKLADKKFYLEKLEEYSSFSTSKISSVFKSAFEVDKTTSEMLDDLRKKLPVPASDISDIFEQCKKEAFQKAVSAFFLSPILAGLDSSSAAKYSNLSEEYKEFKKKNKIAIESTEHFKRLKKEREVAQEQGWLLEDGYNSNNKLNPKLADIEHIVSKDEIFNNFLLRLATTDTQMIKDIMNAEENLIFADASLNGSKGANDFREYLKKNGTPDPANPDIIHIKIQGNDRDITVSRSDAEEKYKKAHQKVNSAKIAAMKEVGLTVANSATKMAVQQVIGLLIIETIDVFVDEIKDMTINGNFFTADTFTQGVLDRKDSLQDKLAARFEERQIVNWAKNLGIESGIAGALSVIPQILISLLIKAPAFVLAIIRECTLSAVRCLRVLFDPSVDRYAAIKVIMAGTATAVLGVYVARIISNAIIPIPILNFCNRQVTEVLSGVFVAALSLSAVYCIEKNKTKLLFAIRKS